MVRRARETVWLLSTLVTFTACDAPKSDAPAPPVTRPAESTIAKTNPGSTATTAPPPPTPASPSVLARSYRGTIGKDLAVVVRLQERAGQVTGSYFYEKSGAGLTLFGDRHGEQLALDERTGAAKTGAMELAFEPSGALVGSWRSANKRDSLPMRLTRIDDLDAPQTALVFRRTIRGTKIAGDRKNHEVCKVEVDYAEVFGLPLPAEKAINTKLAPAEEVQIPATCDHASERHAAYTIVRNEHGILSVRVTGSVNDSEAARGSAGGWCVNAFLQDGSDVKLEGDVLTAGSEKALRAALTPLVDAAAKSEGWVESEPAVLDNLATSSAFTLESAGLRVYPDALPPAFASIAEAGYLVPYAKLPRAPGRLRAITEK